MEPVTAIATKVAEGALTEGAKEVANGFLRTVLHGPGEALSGLWADKVNERRHANLIKIAIRAKERLDAAGISPKAVPLSIIHPALEAASLEEDPDLQDTWANLLANSADPRMHNAIPPSFPAILRELTARDVKFLDAFFTEVCNKRYRPPGIDELEDIKLDYEDLCTVFSKAGLARYPRLRPLTYADWENNREELSADMRDLGLCIDTAKRHGLLAEVVDMSAKKGDAEVRIQGVILRLPEKQYAINTNYSVSYLGAQFIGACRIPNPLATQEDEIKS